MYEVQNSGSLIPRYTKLCWFRVSKRGQMCILTYKARTKLKRGNSEDVKQGEPKGDPCFVYM